MTYLLAADCSDRVAGTLNWTNEVGAQVITVSPSLSGALIPVHVAADDSLVFASGSCYLSSVDMETPKSFTDYEVNLLNYTDVKWPNFVPVVTDGAPGNNDGPYATSPIGILGAGYRSGTPDNPFTFSITTAVNDSYTLGWGASPKYSSEIDAVLGNL